MQVFEKLRQPGIGKHDKLRLAILLALRYESQGYIRANARASTFGHKRSRLLIQRCKRAQASSCRSGSGARKGSADRCSHRVRRCF
jgi:hypothetical protein